VHFGNLSHLQALDENRVRYLQSFYVGEYCVKAVVSFCKVAALQEVEAKYEDYYGDRGQRTDLCFVGDLHAKGFIGGGTLKKDKIQHKKSYRQTESGEWRRDSGVGPGKAFYFFKKEKSSLLSQ
jgi:hypothetical protein